MSQHKEKREMKVIYGGNQMSLIRDTEEVIKFLEFAGRKHILSEQAVNCRLTACNNLFSVLNEDEDGLDYILSNLDVVVNRFRNSNTNVQPSTLKVYKSRVKSSLEDFKAWSADPFAWERAITDKARAAKLDQRREQKRKAKTVAETAPAPAPRKRADRKPAAEPVATPPVAAQTAIEPLESTNGVSRRVSFPIRGDFSVEMTLPPEGLTLKELHRIGLFLYPYCNDIDPAESRWPTITH